MQARRLLYAPQLPVAGSSLIATIRVPMMVVSTGSLCVCTSAPTSLHFLTSSCTVLHPAFKTEYFRQHEWKDKWVQEALRLCRVEWKKYYKPAPDAAAAEIPPPLPPPNYRPGHISAQNASLSTFQVCGWSILFSIQPFTHMMNRQHRHSSSQFRRVGGQPKMPSRSTSTCRF